MEFEAKAVSKKMKTGGVDQHDGVGGCSGLVGRTLTKRFPDPSVALRENRKAQQLQQDGRTDGLIVADVSFGETCCICVSGETFLTSTQNALQSVAVKMPQSDGVLTLGVFGGGSQSHANTNISEEECSEMKARLRRETARSICQR
ncbi:hypothetical protein KUCAC02_034055 [Chaenocephalus aceratus]|nr:hypothetical protein KUCAC02_034055 [Chaenocephalus aceratus]